MHAGSLPHFLLGRLAQLQGAFAVAIFLSALVLLAFGASVFMAAGASQPDTSILPPYRW